MSFNGVFSKIRSKIFWSISSAGFGYFLSLDTEVWQLANPFGFVGML